MNKNLRLLFKELRLAASPLSYIFIAGACMCMIPNYPGLVGAFFVCLGIFYSFQNAREANDVLYTVLLPISKRSAVRAKYMFAVSIECAAFVIFAVLTAVRMKLSGTAVYASPVLMKPNPAFLGFVLIVFAIFNSVFIGGFFKTAYKFAKPFVTFCISTFAFIIVTEIAHHIPPLSFLNSAERSDRPAQWAVFAACALICAAVTFVSMRRSEARFEKIDL